MDTDIKTVALDYELHGPENGPTVVLLHGFPLDRSMWQFQTPALIDAGYRVLLPDLRGLGASAVATPATMTLMARDVLALLDRLDIVEPVALGGLSMGGYVALSLAHIAPSRIRALMLLDTRANADTPEVAANREIQAQTVLASQSAETIVAVMTPRLFGSSAAVRIPDIVAATQSVMRASPPEGVAAALRGMAVRTDHAADLKNLVTPTLVLVGIEDVITPPDVARSMADALPNASLAIITNAGHMAPLEQPDAVNAVILDFLKKTL